MAAYHGEERSKPGSLTRRLVRVFLLLILAGAGVYAFMMRETIWTRVTKVFAATDEDPIPVEKLQKTNFQLEIPAYGEIVGLESLPVPTPSTRSGSLRVAWLVPEGTFVEEGDTLVKYDSSDSLLNLEKQQNTLSANQQNITITQGKQSTNEKTLGIDLEDAKDDYQYASTVQPQDETIFSKWDIIEGQLNTAVAKEKIDLLGHKSGVQKRNARSDTQLLVIARNKAQSEISITQQTLSALELKSPKAGLVLYRRDRMRDPQIGDESQPGQVMIEVIDLNALQARMYVLEREAGALQKNGAVVVRLDSIPEKEFNGTIRTVSALAQPLQRNSPLKYFTCDVLIRDAGPDMKRIKPGMALKAKVVPERYENCFIVPASAVTIKGEEALVYIKQGERFVPRPVKYGAGTHGQAVILDGVKDGETIAMRNPYESRKAHLPDFSKAGVGERGGPGGGGMMRMGGGGPGPGGR
jgi:HlyD family secretion protein